MRHLDGRNGLSRAISRIEILDNVIVNTGRRAISVASATDVRIVGNVIRCDDPRTPTYKDEAVSPIRLRDVDRAAIHGNTITETRPVTPGGVAIEGECSGVDVGD